MEKTIYFIKVIIIGFLAGIICGFFSTGGGMLLVPGFIYLLKMEDKRARGTSIFCILVMVIISSFFYYKGDYINWNIAIPSAIGGAIGGYIGAKLLRKLPEKALKVTFTIFLIYMSIRFIMS